MKKVLVRVPGSCGELIQGFYGGPELLVSYAIDCYSSVTLELSSHFELSINHENEKALEALYKACAYFGLDRSKLKLDICSDIPVGKGMASSTADIVGVLTAVAVFAGKEPDPNWLGKAAAEIEPTDNIMFEDWVLFDHLKGQVVEPLKAIENLNVLVLEMDETINTKDMRASGAFSKADKPNPSNALDLLKRALERGDTGLLGQAVNLSARENQIVLEKPFLAELLELAKKHNLVGINTAHSGTVLGVIYRTGQSPDAFIREAENKGYLIPYSKRHVHKIIRGGPVVTVE